MKPTHVYAMRDPRTGRVRYVGRTVKPLEVRRGEHVRRAMKGGRDHRDAWIRQLLALGLEPTIEPIESGVWSVPQADVRETRWITSMRSVGVPLTNMTPSNPRTKRPDVFQALDEEAGRRRYVDPAACANWSQLHLRRVG